jgi:hypothetical protein
MNPEQLAKSGTEHANQMALFCWANMAMRYGFPTADDMASYAGGPLTQPLAHFHYPSLKWLHAIPNAGARGNKIAAAQLKAEGVKAGVADIFLPVPVNSRPYRYAGLYIELKRLDGKPSDVSAEQKEFGEFVQYVGYQWHVCFGWRAAATRIRDYLLSAP